MPTKKPEGGRTFTFVDYDINRRGVTETARAHLMKDRVRSKREARSEWVSRNQFSPLRWMKPKEEGAQPNATNATATADHTQPSESVSARPIPRRATSHFAAVIDFEKDSITPAPLTKKFRSESPRSGAATTTTSLLMIEALPPVNLDLQDSSSEGSSSLSLGLGRRHRTGSTATTNEGQSRRAENLRASNSPLQDGESATESFMGSPETEHLLSQSQSKPRKASVEAHSEFGLSLLENLKIDSPQTRQFSDISASERSVLSELEDSVDRTPSSPLTPTDCNLIRYFANNAGTMLGLDAYPDIVKKYDPILTLFVPFAISSHWCFETMVLLLGVYHYRKAVPPFAASALCEAENQYIASRQNGILARTRERISALANKKDSRDEDVVAFLFLALAEYSAGHREIGLMHFKAWKEYCEMRRILGIKPCGLPCKTIVWWCISVMVENDVSLDSIINPTTRAKVRDDPEKLFRYFANFNAPKTPPEEKPTMATATA